MLGFNIITKLINVISYFLEPLLPVKSNFSSKTFVEILQKNNITKYKHVSWFYALIY